MIDFFCKIWPYLAGGLLGWLAAGWLARRRLKYTEPSVEKIVEKQVDRIVDNPDHLALISRLENENKEIAGLKTKLSGYESSSSSTRTVDNPAHLKKISELEEEITRLQNASNSTATGIGTGTTSSSPMKAVSGTTGSTKTVDNPVHLQRIKELEAQVSNLSSGTKIDLAAAKAAGFKLKGESDFTAIEGIGPKISDLIAADGVGSFEQLSNTSVPAIQSVLDKAGSRYQIANPSTWPDQANLAANNRWSALRALQDVLVGGVYPDASAKSSSTKSSSKKSSSSTKKPSTGSSNASKVSTADKAAAKAAGFRLKIRNGKDDFSVIEGIGPKINDLIHDDGINTFAQLANTAVSTIQQILDKAGPRYTLAKPGTWPKQAKLAAENKWQELKTLQDELDGGK